MSRNDLGSAAQLEDRIALYGTPIPQDFWDDLKEEGLLHPEAPAAEHVR